MVYFDGVEICGVFVSSEIGVFRVPQKKNMIQHRYGKNLIVVSGRMPCA